MPDTPSSAPQDASPKDRMLSAISFFILLCLRFPSISDTLPDDEGRSDGGDGEELIWSETDVFPDNVDGCGDYCGPQFSGFQFINHNFKVNL